MVYILHYNFSHSLTFIGPCIANIFANILVILCEYFSHILSWNLIYLVPEFSMLASVNMLKIVTTTTTTTTTTTNTSSSISSTLRRMGSLNWLYAYAKFHGASSDD